MSYLNYQDFHNTHNSMKILMKTKVLVIPIDLGFVIDDIINTDLTLLTKDSKDQLDRAISVAKAIQAVKDQKTQSVSNQK